MTEPNVRPSVPFATIAAGQTVKHLRPGVRWFEMQQTLSQWTVLDGENEGGLCPTDPIQTSLSSPRVPRSTGFGAFRPFVTGFGLRVANSDSNQASPN